VSTAGSTHLPGFPDPVLDAQATYRNLLAAISRPGTVHALPTLPPSPSPLYETTTAVCLSLLDLHTPVWMDIAPTDRASTADYLRFHCGCPIVTRKPDAAFALITESCRSLDISEFNQGTPEYPDRSATLFIQVEGLAEDRGYRLTGPGIANERQLAVEGLDENLFIQFRQNRDLYPLGVDLFLMSPHTICSLPRTLRVEAGA
jgi:alpha-D-ribose 1-methylphosphonate 5-triphosphate synthase subunit PhnH